MVVADLLHSLGVSGSIVTIAVALVGLKHGREILALFGTLGLAARVAGVLLFVFVVVSSGLIPGLEVSVDANLTVLGRLVADGFDLVADGLRVVLP